MVEKDKYEHLGTPYDFNSIMHYHFNKDMKPLKPVPKDTWGLSKYDKIAAENKFCCIKNGKRIRKKRIIMLSAKYQKRKKTWIKRNRKIENKERKKEEEDNNNKIITKMD